VTFTPASGPVGTEVTFHGPPCSTWLGDLATWEDFVGDGAPFMALSREVDAECELWVDWDGYVHLTEDRGIAGGGIIGRDGACKGTGGEGRPAEPGVYNFSVGCVPCFVGEFTIVEPQPTPAAPQSTTTRTPTTQAPSTTSGTVTETTAAPDALPRTGYPIGILLTVGIGALLAGSALVTAASRRR
jgi:hypothetical protein